MRRVVLLILLTVILACGGLGSDAPEEVAPVDVPTVSPPTAPPPPASPPPTRLPPQPATVLPADADPIAAFIEDCAAAFTVEDETAGGQVIECEFMEFDQMCAEDSFGCWNKGDSCRGGCGEPCTTCQTNCAAGCTDCKADCNGDAACIRQCAESRQSCRVTCLDGLTTCKDDTCSEVESDCYKQAELTTRRVCPRCDELQECIMASYSDGTFADDPCRGKIKADERCYTWCHPGL
ncbi:MAG: hypothetical protein ACI8RZ_004309 [Myxococcota bacterium]|jgi:hypothetical protein